MENLTLTTKEYRSLKRAFAIAFGATTAVFLLILTGLGEEATLLAGARCASIALSITTAAFWAFYKWAWRISWPTRLTKKPLLGGVWLGYLSSDYRHAKEPQSPIRKPIAFVVRQTYLSLSIQSFTDTQNGESISEALLQNERTQAIRLAYIFELKNLYAGTRELTSGAGDLRLLENSSVLEGNYWTNTPTHGSLSLKRIAESVKDMENLDSFESILKKWPIGPTWHSH